MSSSELIMKTEDQTLQGFFQNLIVAQKSVIDMLAVHQHRLTSSLFHSFYVQENSQLKIVQDKSFNLLTQTDEKENFCFENTHSTLSNNYLFPKNEQHRDECQMNEELVENLKNEEEFEDGADREIGYCSLLDEENISTENFDNDPEIDIHHEIIEDDSDDDYYEEDEEFDGDNENEIKNAINCFVVVQYSCPGLKSQKLHQVARITDEKLVDDQVQFTVNFYEKNLQNDGKFLPCISNLKTNININEEDIIIWLGDPTKDSCDDDGLKFPFDFKNFNL